MKTIHNFEKYFKNGMVLQNHLCVQEKETCSAAWVGAHVATFCDLWDMYGPPEEILENTMDHIHTFLPRPPTHFPRVK